MDYKEYFTDNILDKIYYQTDNGIIIKSDCLDILPYLK